MCVHTCLCIDCRCICLDTRRSGEGSSVDRTDSEARNENVLRAVPFEIVSKTLTELSVWINDRKCVHFEMDRSLGNALRRFMETWQSKSVFWKVCNRQLRHFSGWNDVIHRQHVITKIRRYVRGYTWECIPGSWYRRGVPRKSKRIFVVRMICISSLKWSRRDETSLKTSSLLFQNDYWNHLLNSWKLSFADCRLMSDPLLFSLKGANSVNEIWSCTWFLRLFSRTDHTWK